MSDSDFALRLASPAELREMVQTLTRERDEARAEVERLRAEVEKLRALPSAEDLEERAHEILDGAGIPTHALDPVSGEEDYRAGLEERLEWTVEEITRARIENARLRAALRLAEGPIAIAASYADQPCETMGMRVHAKDCARILPEIHAALAGEGHPARTLDRHGADRGRWVGVWEAINRYAQACGGSPTAGGPSRMEAVVEVECALDAALAGEGEGASDA